MSLHMLQMAIDWLGSKDTDKQLWSVAWTICYTMRCQGIRELTLHFANNLLLTALRADAPPRVYRCALDFLKLFPSTYPDLRVDLVLKLLESSMSWKGFELRGQARSTAAYMLEAIMLDHEAFTLANRHLNCMQQAEERGNMAEAAARYQKAMGLLTESKVRS